MVNSSVSTYKIAALFGFAWLILIIDACFTWYLTDRVRIFVGFLFVLLGSLMLIQTQGIKYTKQVRWQVLSVLLLMGYFIIVTNSLFSFCKYFPLILVSLWKPLVLKEMYAYFRKFVIFYAILSIIVEVLFMSGLWRSIPYLTIFPPQDFVQESQIINNYFYGLFCIPYNNADLLYRACGPLREGGHWIFFLGFVYFVDRVLYNQRNIWLIICGILTLSPNFILFFGGAEAYNSIKQKNIKPILGVVGFIVLLIFVYPLLPNIVKSEVARILFERTLENSFSNYYSDGFIAFFDGRAGYNSLNVYYSFERSNLETRLFGMPNFDAVMSDYRWMLMYAGYIGTVLVLWCIYCFSFGRERNLFGFILLIFVLFIFLQRAWMFHQVYIWAMMLLVLNEKYLIDRKARYVKKTEKVEMLM